MRVGRGMQRGGSQKEYTVLYKRFLARVYFGHYTCSLLTFFRVAPRPEEVPSCLVGLFDNVPPNFVITTASWR